jgi:polyhydroxybutyrate depolymerase
MFMLALLMLLTGSAWAGTTAGPENSGLHIQHMRHQDSLRRYALYVPENPGPSPPLVIELHGGGIHMEDMTGESGYRTPYRLWMPLADREKFLVVYPEGLDGIYGKPTWNDCRANASVNSDADDTGFIAALIDRLSSRWHIDPRRVYVSGTSNGGLMALRLAVELPERIAAVAAIAAAMPDVSGCPAPETPVSVLFMNGTDDNHLPWKGGTLGNPPDPDHGSVFSTPRSVRIWRNLDATDKAPVICRYPDRDGKDGSTVRKQVWANGRSGTEVVLYKITGGGHSAPSRKERYSRLFERYFNRQNHDIEMVQEVWRFFRSQHLHSLPEVDAANH